MCQAYYPVTFNGIFHLNTSLPDTGRIREQCGSRVHDVFPYQAGNRQGENQDNPGFCPASISRTACSSVSGSTGLTRNLLMARSRQDFWIVGSMYPE